MTKQIKYSDLRKPITMTICEYSEKCTGCSLWTTPYQQQTQQKIDHLKSLFKFKLIEIPNNVEFVSFGEYGLRHRVDFTLSYDEKKQQHHFGFYDSNHHILDVKKCLQMSEQLLNFFKEFRTLRFFYNKDIPIKKGSIRLRIGPNGERGCWLDFSNIDIKNLLTDRVLLSDLLKRGYHVEIGQKGKQLQFENDLLKLKEPKSEKFFATVGPQNDSLILKCLVSDFTQPSWVSAARMVQDTLKFVSENSSIKNVVEFGSGIGQFTVSFLKSDLNVSVFEINPSACSRLQENADYHRLDSDLKIYCGDYQNKKAEFSTNTDLVFVNPARSGLKNFVRSILDSQARFILYLSCFPETMVEDLSQFTYEYKIRNIIIYDQFPQTQHYETMTLLEKLS